jgi:hypothetical protein
VGPSDDCEDGIISLKKMTAEFLPNLKLKGVIIQCPGNKGPILMNRSRPSA